MWRGGLGAAYPLPALSSAGASIASPCFRFHIVADSAASGWFRISVRRNLSLYLAIQGFERKMCRKKSKIVRGWSPAEQARSPNSD
jgi:hypothetical protein